MFKRSICSICGQSWKPISRKGGENIFLERGERDVNSDLRHSAFFIYIFPNQEPGTPLVESCELKVLSNYSPIPSSFYTELN